MRRALWPALVFALAAAVAAREPSLYHLFRATTTRALAIGSFDATLVTSPPTGSLPAVLRSSLSASSACLPTSDDTCAPAPSFGLVGAARYVFNDSLRNVAGSSLQTLYACRCLSRDCSVAVRLRPVDTPGGPTCIYEKVDGGFADCHSQPLTLVSVKRGSGVLGRPGAREEDTVESKFTDAVEYTVYDAAAGDFWNVSGTRGWASRCADREVARLPRAPPLNAENVRVAAPGLDGPSACTPSAGYTFYRAPDSATCGRLYAAAVARASHQATQQDCYAVGKRRAAYLRPPAGPLASDTAIALSCAAAALGLLVLAHASAKRRQRTGRAALIYLGLQVLAFGLEALPLIVVLAEEVDARRWVSLFAFVDSVVAMERPGDATGGVLVFTTVVGEVGLNSTRAVLLAALTAMFLMLGVATVAVPGVFFRRKAAVQDGAGGKAGSSRLKWSDAKGSDSSTSVSV